MREQETMAESQDTEITLGAGKLLGLFFSLVILCGISLGTGYWLGRNSTKQAVGAVPPLAATATASTNQAPLSGGKPAAAQAPVQPVQPKTPDCAGGDNCVPQAAASSSPSDLTFYQAVQQKESHPQLSPPPPAQQAASEATASPAAETHGTLGNGYVVQIAAVRNQDDAKLLSETLRKQQYPVLISQPGDSLFHVQVGPYADINEAETIRKRLVSAGYNPFLKH